MESNTLRRDNYFPALTGLRAIAAYMVVAFHENMHVFSQPITNITFFNQFISTWSTGVTIFFVLSGFLITLRYQSSINLTSSWLRAYFQNRFARIYPVYFLLTSVTLLFIWKHNGFNFYNLRDCVVILFLNLTLLRGFFQDLVSQGVVPAWSLTVEETFYLLAPVLLIGINRRWWPLLVYPIIITAFGFLLYYGFKGTPYGLMGSIEYVSMFTFFGRCFEFIIGIALGKFFTKISTKSNYAFTLSGALGFLVCLLIIVAINLSVSPTMPGTHLYFILFVLYAAPLPVALLLLGLCREKTLLSQFLSHPWMQRLGTASYSLYLLHYGVIPEIISYKVTNNPIIKIIIYTIISLLIYKFIEHPIHSRLRFTRVKQTS